jgi:hypothetical protein
VKTVQFVEAGRIATFVSAVDAWKIWQMLPEDPEVFPTSGYIREPPELPSGPETVRYEREAGGTVYTWETVHARHSGLVRLL